MIDQRVIAEFFPRHPRGYFDHAAVSTVPAAVEASVAGVARALAGGTTGSPDWHALTDGMADLLALDLGVAPSAITVLANTSTAITAAARAIPFAAGDVVLTFADDFPSPRMPWRTIPGVVTREIAPEDGADRTEALVSALDASTRAVAVTHVHATTGATLDLERLHRACIAADALLIVDGAQAAGLLTGGAAHADVYVAPSYKWLLAGFGAAVIATGARFDEQAVPTLIGYLNAPPSPKLEIGHGNLFGLAALSAAAEFAMRSVSASVCERIASSPIACRTSAAELGLPIAQGTRGAGIVSLRVADAAASVAELAERGITATVREGALRLSPYLTTTDDDVDLLVSALADTASAHRPHEGVS